MPTDPRPRVLVVDDDPFVRSLFPRILSSERFELLQAQTPGEALRLAAEQTRPIDLLVTDVVMPELDGPSLVAQLRDRWPSLSVLYMSGYHQSALLSRGVGAADAFLDKPFTPHTLTSAVQSALAGEDS